jgi:hypothetical protein
MIYGDLNSLRHSRSCLRIKLMTDLPLPDPVYDLLDSMMHQQAKKRPTAEEILDRLREIEKTLKSASRKPHCKSLSPIRVDVQCLFMTFILPIRIAIPRCRHLDYRINRYRMGRSLLSSLKVRVDTSTTMRSWRNWYVQWPFDAWLT